MKSPIENLSSIKDLINKLLKHPTESTHIQFFRYIFVGGVAFFVDFSSLYLLTDFLGVYYLISAALAFILGLITNYLLSITWVFNKRSFDNLTVEFGLFSFIGIIGLGLTEIFIWFFTAELGMYYMISKIITAILILFWNFFARKLALFR